MIPRVAYFNRLTGVGRFDLTIDDKPMLRFSDEGRLARVEPDALDLLPLYDLIRHGAPLGLAPQGVACLHGSAVKTDAGVIAILGVGGAGKSTLAGRLASVGWDPVLDDLIVCDDQANVDLGAEALVCDWSAATAGATGDVVSYADLATRLATSARRWEPLRLVVLLGERMSNPEFDAQMDASDDEPAAPFLVEPLSPMSAVVAINEHRFGSHPLAAAWAPQLRAVAGIANRVPVVRLRSPDGLDALDAMLVDIAADLARRCMAGDQAY